MLEPWKHMSLLPPPIHTSKCDNNIDVKQLLHTCNNISRVLSKQSPLHKECAILSRFLYKYDKKFRNDIGYRNIRKVNIALHKYLLLNLLKDVERFTSALPLDNDNYLPTRQMLEYVMVRIMAFSKLMLRIYVCSKQAAIFYLDRVKRGESHWMSLMPYALLCRLWSMGMVLLQHSSSWYTCLYPYLNKLNLKGLIFLPVNYTLPEDIEEWLDMKNLDRFGRLEWSQKKCIEIDMGLVQDNECDTFDNILGYVNQINDEDPEQELNTPVSDDFKDNQQLQVSSEVKVDHGEAISRESFNIMVNFQKKISTANNNYSHYIERVTNIDSLKEFINKEEGFRNKNNKQSLTNHLSFMQWHALKKSLLMLCNPLSSNRKIERKVQKIWREKCSDCA